VRAPKKKALVSTAAALALVAFGEVISGCGGSMPRGTEASASARIATVQQATTVAASAGHVVWSTYDSRKGLYRLTQRFRGKTSFLPVAPRSVPFDVDLGVDARGRVLAAYSRCKHESNELDGAGDLPDYTRGRGCDIYAFDFHSRREFKVKGASSKTASEYLPTVSALRQRSGARVSLVAFGRTYDERRGRQGRYKLSRLPDLYFRPLGDRGRSRRLPAGPRGRVGGPGPSRLDLDGRYLVFDWTYFPLNPRGVRLFQIRLASVMTGMKKVLDESGSMSGELSADFLVAPLKSGSRIYWLSRKEGEDGEYATVFRYRIPGHQCAASARRLVPEAISLAVDGGLTFYVQQTPGYDTSSYDIQLDRQSYDFQPAVCGRMPR
jgi:hypothetical protein